MPRPAPFRCFYLLLFFVYKYGSSHVSKLREAPSDTERSRRWRPRTPCRARGVGCVCFAPRGGHAGRGWGAGWGVLPPSADGKFFGLRRGAAFAVPGRAAPPGGWLRERMRRAQLPRQAREKKKTAGVRRRSLFCHITRKNPRRSPCVLRLRSGSSLKVHLSRVTACPGWGDGSLQPTLPRGPQHGSNSWE